VNRTALLFTRLNAALLVAVFGMGIFQSLLSSRDPQLAILYTLIVLALAFVGADDFRLMRG